MNGIWFESPEETASGTLFRDLLMAVLAVVVFILVIILMHINPDEKKDEHERKLGNIRAEIVWPHDLPIDFDLWVQAPNESPVGYSNKTSQTFSLVRDDLGHPNDMSGINYEVSSSRGLPAGQYTINIHWYSDRSASYMMDDPDIDYTALNNNTPKYRPTPSEVPVVALVSISKGKGTKADKQSVIQTEVLMKYVGEEQTVVGFELDGEGNIIEGSVHSIYTAIRGSTRFSSTTFMDH